MEFLQPETWREALEAKRAGQFIRVGVEIGSRWIVGFDQPRIERELARLS